jgi:GxxExxY protein
MIGEMPAEVERIGARVVESAYVVHRELGPGLLESIYQICLAHELRKRGHEVEREVKLPVVYDGIRFEAGLELDLLVDRLVIVETKSVERMHEVYEAQLLSQLKLANLDLGYLINFNVTLIKDGIRRKVLSKRRHPQRIPE